MGAGHAARHLAFARDAPHRAVAQIPLGGAPQAHTWDLSSGRVVTATEGPIRDPMLTPDGEWLWWFDHRDDSWWRRPFGSSPRGRREQPLRLRPAADVKVALGGEGTAIVARPVPGVGHTFSLLPVGRIRAGAEPTFLCAFTHVRKFLRSLDDALLAVDTGRSVHVCCAYTGRVVAEEPGGWHLAGFTSAGEILLVQGRGLEGEPAAITARLWDPRSALRRPLPLTGIDHPTRVTLSYRGAGALVEARRPGGEPGSGEALTVWRLPLHGEAASMVGPSSGTILPGSSLGGPGGQVYALWRDDGAAARLTNLTEAESPGRATGDGRRYRPAIGGYDA